MTTVNTTFTVMGQRKTKRDPIVSSSSIKELGIKVGDIIDDGTNNPIVLANGFPENVCDIMLENLKKHHDKKVWKFWIE